MFGNFVHVNVFLVGVVNVAAPKFIIAYYRFWSGNIDGLYLFVLKYLCYQNDFLLQMNINVVTKSDR